MSEQEPEKMQQPPPPPEPKATTSTSAWIYELKKEDLQARLRKLGQNTTGTVAILRKRMVAVVQILKNATENTDGTEPQDEERNEDEVPLPAAPEFQYSPARIHTPVQICETMRKWNTQFDGKSDPVSFFERIAELKDSYHIQDHHLLIALPELFRGAPLQWYRNNRAYWGELKDFIANFKEFFIGSDYALRLKEEINRRKQKIGEKGRDYVTEIQTLIRRCSEFSKEQELFYVYHNMLPEYRQYIRWRDITTIRGLIREIEEYERLQQELRPQRPAHITALEAPTSALKAGDGVMCWRCGERGHFRTTCRNVAKLFCSRCNKQGVLTRECECRERGYATLAAALPVIEKKKRHDNRIYVDIFMKGHELRALIDTGAMHSFINDEVAHGLMGPHTLTEPTYQEAQLADGTRVPIRGNISARCTIQGVWKPLVFLRMPNLTHDIVLGMDAIKAFAMRIDVVQKKVGIPPVSMQVCTVESTLPNEQILAKFLAEEIPKHAQTKGIMPLARKAKSRDMTPSRPRGQLRTPPRTSARRTSPMARVAPLPLPPPTNIATLLSHRSSTSPKSPLSVSPPLKLNPLNQLRGKIVGRLEEAVRPSSVQTSEGPRERLSSPVEPQTVQHLPILSARLARTMPSSTDQPPMGHISLSHLRRSRILVPRSGGGLMWQTVTDSTAPRTPMKRRKKKRKRGPEFPLDRNRMNYNLYY